MADFIVPRITEKRYYAIPPQSFTADGTVDGVVTILNTYSFKVGQLVILKSNTQNLKVKIQKVISETQLIVINIDQAVTTKSKLDISMFLVADTATIELLEDKRPVIDLHEIQRQVYEEEPTVALRSHSVDWLGRPYDKTNPLPVQLSDGSINIGTVNAELEVQLSHKDNVPNAGDVADSIQVGDEATIAKVDPLNRSWSMNRYEKLLGLLANANWMNLGDFDTITPSFSGNVATLAYIQNGATIGEAFCRFVTDYDWDIQLKRYINDTNGDVLLDDDNEPLNLD